LGQVGAGAAMAETMRGGGRRRKRTEKKRDEEEERERDTFSFLPF